jgi:hypothetical protein
MLTSEIHTTLSPDAALPTKAVSAAVDQVANRVNYGIDGGLKVCSAILRVRVTLNELFRIFVYGGGKSRI